MYAWKDIMEAMLDDNGVLEYINTDIPKPSTSYVQQLTQWKKDISKSKRMMLEGVTHIVPNFHGKEIPFLMWKPLTDLFERNSDAKNYL